MVDGRHSADVALVSYLSPLLPDYMVPRRYLRLDSVPRTVSGKVDRARLPDPVQPAPLRAPAPQSAPEPFEEVAAG